MIFLRSLFFDQFAMMNAESTKILVGKPATPCSGLTPKKFSESMFWRHMYIQED